MEFAYLFEGVHILTEEFYALFYLGDGDGLVVRAMACEEAVQE